MCVASPNATMGGDNFDVVQNLKRKMKEKENYGAILTIQMKSHPPDMHRTSPNRS